MLPIDIHNNRIWTLIFEICIALISPMPFLMDITYEETNVNYDIKIDHRVNDIFMVLMFAKTYIPCRFVLMASYFQSSRAQRVCEVNGHRASYLFSIKCMMIDSPYTVVAANLIGSIFVFGYTIRIFDTALNEASGQNFDEIKNVLWLTIVTMTTVGYGGFYPKSEPSRLIGVLLAFWGVYLTSLFVVTLTNALNWDESERRSYFLIDSLEQKEELKIRSIYMLT